MERYEKVLATLKSEFENARDQVESAEEAGPRGKGERVALARLAVEHLERSNVELNEALSTNGPDHEFEDAVKENKRVVAEYQEKVYKLTVEIAGIKGEVEKVTPKGTTTEADGQWL